MKATLLDTVTGKTVDVDDINGFQWTDGNWSCDCNRESYFDVESDDDGHCLGGERFLVIRAEPNGLHGDRNFTLRDMNSGYPEELLDKHLPE